MTMLFKGYGKEDDDLNKDVDTTLIENFALNIYGWEQDSSKIVSYRFFAGLMITSLWIHLIDGLKVTNWFGSSFAKVRHVISSIKNYFLMWLVSLALFACISIIWLGDESNYATFN